MSIFKAVEKEQYQICQCYWIHSHVRWQLDGLYNNDYSIVTVPNHEIFDQTSNDLLGSIWSKASKAFRAMPSKTKSRTPSCHHATGISMSQRMQNQIPTTNSVVPIAMSWVSNCRLSKASFLSIVMIRVGVTLRWCGVVRTWPNFSTLGDRGQETGMKPRVRLQDLTPPSCPSCPSSYPTCHAWAWYAPFQGPA